MTTAEEQAAVSLIEQALFLSENGPRGIMTWRDWQTGATNFLRNYWRINGQV